jgi:hypothetical protein
MTLSVRVVLCCVFCCRLIESRNRNRRRTAGDFVPDCSFSLSCSSRLDTVPLFGRWSSAAS